ncbi:pectate lyase [Brevundimonas sp. DC300-4]|uniref:pectate lyase n=1 Tax=Brevundimonas sp. DC300-4 TaxID=2804594 RepID=UPI003CF86966
MIPNLSRRGLLLTAAATGLMGAAPGLARAADRSDILATMKRATRFMTNTVAVGDGYVWSYTPDLSRRWGELEASPTMIWVQPPGTATMGNLFLDAYHATGDEDYYAAATRVADALVRGQLPSGGWNYVIDTAGEASLDRWYDTFGKNAWRMEEFQHHYPNATFDDVTTQDAANFMLRIWLEKRDARYRGPLDKAIGFVLESQYPSGGWPQRYPRVPDGGLHGNADYSGYITFNDDVSAENIKFLTFCYQSLGERRFLDPIRRAMDCFIATQQPSPQPGWAMQYEVGDLEPVGARSYEPRALATHGTAGNLDQLMDFYVLTGQRKYLARVEEGIDWLEAVTLPELLWRDGKKHSTYVEIGTNEPLWVHRRGSNVANGEYYVNEDPRDIVVHTGGLRSIDVAGLRARYAELAAKTSAQASAGSALLAEPGAVALPRYFTTQARRVSDLNSGSLRATASRTSAERVDTLVAELNAEGYWPSLLASTSNPYVADSTGTVALGEFRITRVGDASDTSPWLTDFPQEGISTGVYIHNMGELIEALGPA